MFRRLGGGAGGNYQKCPKRNRSGAHGVPLIRATFRETSFLYGFAKWLKGLAESASGSLPTQKNSSVFNDITIRARNVRPPTFVDFALTNCQIGRLDSVKRGNKWQLGLHPTIAR
jgi:hypothetical protein